MKSHNSGTTEAVTIGATATLIKSYTRELEADPIITISIANISNSVVWYGFDSGVTTASGFPIAPGAVISDSGYHGSVYGITSSGTAEVRVRYY